MTTISNLEIRALNYLARREYSRKELKIKLAMQPCTQHELSVVLDKLEQQNYLSEKRVVEQTIQARRHRFGYQRITHELKEKGIADHLIEEALTALKETEFEAAQEVWQKKFGVLPIDTKTRGKQIRFLISRGFSSDSIHQVLSPC